MDEHYNHDKMIIILTPIIVMGMGGGKLRENGGRAGEKKLLQEVEEADQPVCGEFSARS